MTSKPTIRVSPEQMARPTMADVAEHAGVSTITVSRALRGDPSVRPETRERIVEAARETGYRFNLPARNLRLNRSRTVSVVVETPASPAGLIADPYPLDLLRGLSQELTGAGYSLLLATIDDLDATPLQAAEAGILLGQGADDSALRRIARTPIPWVVWGSETPGFDYPVVGSDNDQGGVLAAERFAKLGRRRAVFLGDIRHAEIAARAAGFTRATAAAGGSVVRREACDFTYAAGVEATRRLLEAGVEFDAVFACSDLIAMGAVSALAERGRRTPEDVAVIGYDDTPVGATFVPPLTSVHQNWREGGALLARKALDLIEGRDAGSAKLPAALTVRAT
jgi:DNA-binding LacI/PurR family transcriptional regulator